MEKENSEIDYSLKLIARSSVVVFLGIFLSKVLTYIYRIVIAREFGPSEYGLFTLATILLGWFITFSNLGLSNGMVRFVSLFLGKNKKNKIKSVFWSSFKVAFSISLLAGILLFAISTTIALYFFKEPRLGFFLKVFAFAIPLSVIFEFFLSLLLAYREVMWYSFIHKILNGSLKVVLFLVIILIGLREYSIPFSYVASLLISTLFVLFLCKFKYPFLFSKNFSVKKSKEKLLFRKIFTYSWPLLFYGFLWQVFNWADSFIIGYFKTAADVGIYNSAVPISFLLTITTQIFAQLFFPLITKEYASRRRKTVEALSKQIGKWIFMINFPVLLIFVLYPGAFINILFGTEYLSAANSLRFLTIGTFFFSIFSISNKLIIAKGFSKVIMADIIIAFIINLILNFILIPIYGIDGAAFSTMLSLILLSIFFGIQSKSYLSILPLKRNMIRFIFAAAIPAFFVYHFQTLLAPSIFSSLMLLLTFLVSYVLLALLFRGFDKNDFMVLRAFLKKTGINLEETKHNKRSIL